MGLMFVIERRKIVKSVLLVMVLLVSVYGFGDEQKPQEEMVTVSVPKSSLTPQQQATLKQQEVKGWVGIGKEVGEAVNSSLEAITTQANNFSHTGVGKLTVAVVIWKVIGGQALHVVGALLFAVVSLPIWLWSYRRTSLSRRVLVKETINPDKTKIREWKLVSGDDQNQTDMENWRGGHWAAMVCMLIVFFMTMFTY